MILSFSEKFPWGEPTKFIGKIKIALHQKRGVQFNPHIAKPKIHTIRADPSHRWYKGMKIHFWQGSPRNPGPDVYEFGRGVCTGVQDIKILPARRSVYIDRNGLSNEGIKRLAVNDGFDSVEEFFEYFRDGDEVFSGRLIHWTDFKY